MVYLFVIIAIGLGAYLTILLTKFLLCLYVIRREPTGNEPLAPELVTVVQPILGGDPRLSDVLRSTLQNTSPDTRFLWLVDKNDAPGQAAVKTLCEEYPARIEVVWCDPVPEEVNPKAFKLQKAVDRIETPFVAILDDDTTISQRNLETAVAALGQADLYTGIPCYRSTAGYWDSLVTHFVNNNSIMTYLSMLPLVGPITINGMFYVMPTQTLRELDGFSSIQDRLCDDYAVARLLRDSGKKIHQGIVPQYLFTSISGFRHYMQIMHRWFVFADALVRDQSLAVRMILLVMLGLPPLLLGIGLAGTLVLLTAAMTGYIIQLYTIITAMLLGVTLVVRHVTIRVLHRKLFAQDVRLRPMMSIVSELLQPIHWLHSVFVSTIQWRTRRIRVHKDNTFKILDP
ncbi:MAG: glycosyltransferase [Planctomycetia bacterium]|jgi:ceramide glucosyltransferase